MEKLDRLLNSATVSCSGLEIRIDCDDHDTKDAIMELLTGGWREPVPPRDWLDTNEPADFIPSKGWRRYIRWIWYGI